MAAIFSGDTVIGTTASAVLGIGSHNFGPISIPDSFTTLVIAYDITNQQNGSTVNVVVNASVIIPSGTNVVLSFSRTGGTYPTPTEAGIPTGWCYVRISLPSGTGRSVSGTLTVSGQGFMSGTQVEGQ